MLIFKLQQCPRQLMHSENVGYGHLTKIISQNQILQLHQQQTYRLQMMSLKQLLQLLKFSNHCRLPLKRYRLNLFYLQYRHIYIRKLLSQSLSLDHLCKPKIAFPGL